MRRPETRVDIIWLKIPEKIQFGIQIPREQFSSIEQINRITSLIEKNDFDSAWLEDHIVDGTHGAIPRWFDCFTCLAMMGLRTKRLRVGSLVTDQMRRHPTTLAQTGSTISAITEGRFILGIGAGEAYQLLPLSLPLSNRLTRLKEALDIIRLIWESKPETSVSYHGRYYELEGFSIAPIKPVHVPPIFVAAFGTKMLALTGQLGDGWLPFAYSPAAYRDDLEFILKSGQKRASMFVPACVMFSSLSTDKYEAFKRIASVSKRHVAWVPSIMRRLGLTLPEGLSLAGLSNWDYDSDKLSEFARQIPDEVALDSVIAGDTNDWVEQIDKFVKVGLRHIIFRIEYPRAPRAEFVLKTIRSKVLPYFRDQGNSFPK